MKVTGHRRDAQALLNFHSDSSLIWYIICSELILENQSRLDEIAGCSRVVRRGAVFEALCRAVSTKIVEIICFLTVAYGKNMCVV